MGIRVSKLRELHSYLSTLLADYDASKSVDASDNTRDPGTPAAPSNAQPTGGASDSAHRGAKRINVPRVDNLEGRARFAAHLRGEEVQEPDGSPVIDFGRLHR